MKVVTVQLQKSFNVSLCDAGEESYKSGDIVVVRTKEGTQLGEVITGALKRSSEVYPKPGYKIERLATEEDFKMAEEDLRKAAEAFKVCKQKIVSLGLPMKLLDVQFAPAGEKVTFFFTAENRVNFRELVKQLAAEFHTRVELRQVGARNEAQKIGGVGCCGRPICCASFLPRFEPVTIRMAKDQGLSLEPAKISGLCGRLLCCLSFEAGTYADQLKKLPKQGSRVSTPYGEGRVIKLNPLEPSLVVELEEGRRMTFTPEEIRKKGKSDDITKKNSSEEIKKKSK